MPDIGNEALQPYVKVPETPDMTGPDVHYAHYGNTEVPEVVDAAPENPDVAWDENYVPMNYIERFKRLEQRLDAVADGVNTIGQMMNEVADAFAQIMEQVQKGGIGGLLGSVMGGKKNDE